MPYWVTSIGNENGFFTSDGDNFWKKCSKILIDTTDGDQARVKCIHKPWWISTETKYWHPTVFPEIERCVHLPVCRPPFYVNKLLLARLVAHLIGSHCSGGACRIILIKAVYGRWFTAIFRNNWNQFVREGTSMSSKAAKSEWPYAQLKCTLLNLLPWFADR